MVLTIVLIVLAAWLLVSVLLALLIGRTVRLADRRHRASIDYRRVATADRHTAATRRAAATARV